MRCLIEYLERKYAIAGWAIDQHHVCPHPFLKRVYARIADYFQNP